MVVACSILLLIEPQVCLADFTTTVATSWFPSEAEPNWFAPDNLPDDVGGGLWIADTFASNTGSLNLYDPPTLATYSLLTLHEVFAEEDAALFSEGSAAFSWPGEPSPGNLAVRYVHRTQPGSAKPQAAQTASAAQASTATQPDRPSVSPHPRLGQAWHSRFDTDPSSSIYSARFGDSLPHAISPPDWEWSRREGSRALGERFELVGQTIDLQGSAWMHEPRLGQVLEDRGDTLLPRVGFQYEIMPDQMIGYYAYEQAAIGHHGDNLLRGTSDYLPFGGENHRAGVQTRSSDGRWELVASGFYSETDLSDALFASPRFSRSVGAILSVNARVTRRWNTTFRVSGIESYGLTADEEEEWRIPRKESNSSLSIWNRIRIWEDADQNLTLGLGTRLVSNYKNSYADSMVLPGYSRWDVGLFYRRRGLDARVYVESILDAGYYEGADHLLNHPDSPLAVEAKVQLRY